MDQRRPESYVSTTESRNSREIAAGASTAIADGKQVFNATATESCNEQNHIKRLTIKKIMWHVPPRSPDQYDRE
jgi:hypothetical protein